MCLSVASVPFFGGGGRFGRSWGMRQSLPTSVVRAGAARRAVQAAAHRMSWAARGGRLRALAGLAIIINETNVLCRLIGRRVASMGAQFWHLFCLLKFESAEPVFEKARQAPVGIIQPPGGVSARPARMAVSSGLKTLAKQRSWPSQVYSPFPRGICARSII